MSAKRRVDSKGRFLPPKKKKDIKGAIAFADKALVDEILEDIHDLNEGALFPTGYEEAVIGYVERFGMNPQVLVDRDKMLDIMVKRDGMTYEEALEYFEYNVIGAWMGDGTPLFATIKRK